jgi:HD-GYP domain-containing protein (c-di-GMP phosphodiesterase class II)
MKLSRAIVLLVFAVAAVPTLLMLVVTSVASRTALLASARELTQERADRLRLRVADRLEPSERALDLAAQQIPWTELGPDERRQQLSVLSMKHGELLAVTVFDASGHSLPGAEVGADAAGAAFMANTAAMLPKLETMAFSGVYSVRGGSFVNLAVPLPVRAGGAAPVGYLAAKISLQPIRDLVARQAYKDGTEAVVLDRSGRTIATHIPADGAEADFSSPLSSPIVDAYVRERAALDRSGEVRSGEFALRDGSGAIGAYAVVPIASWGVAVLEPKSAALSLSHWVEREGAFGLLLGLALSIVLGLLFARSIVDPVRRMVAEALDISRGIFGHEVKLKTRNEIGDLAHTFNYMSKQLQAYDSENRGLYESLEKGYLETIVALANSIDSKDSYTRGHSQRVGDLSRAVGAEMRLPDDVLKHLFYGGILHDIGKIGIPERVLLKQTILSDEEMTLMRQHPVIGASIVQPVAFLAPSLPCVRSHHERWDGSGYPDKLKGADIPLVARIVNVADTWDACTSTRPYQVAMGYEEALAVIRRLSGSQFDPDVVAPLFRALEKWRAAGRPVVAADGGQRPRMVVGV